jgi:signal-transduction protein with cAMP-binding, CBS, and nucleotidyltransferase domain
MNELLEFIRSHAELGQEELTVILAQFQHRLVAKNKHILRRGHAARHYLFIRRGLLRVYFEDARNVEITGWIAAEQDFLCDLSSLKTGVPSRFSIQTLEESEIYMIEHSQMERLYAQFPAWQQFGRQIWESAFMRMLDAIIAY